MCSLLRAGDAQRLDFTYICRRLQSVPDPFTAHLLLSVASSEHKRVCKAS